MSSVTSFSEGQFISLFKSSLVPAYVILVALTWLFYDYLITFDEEVRFVWPQRWNRGKISFLFVRYYTIGLLVLNVAQIHLFTHPGYATNTSCVAFDLILRIMGAIALWAIEIIIQLRIYALFRCSRKIAIFNVVLFFCSICAFLGVTIYSGIQRKKLIATAIHLPLPGCPVINGGIQWAEWIPATIYEAILFGFALFKHVQGSQRGSLKSAGMARKTLTDILINDNMWYFFGVAFVLMFNNLMVAGKTHIPWFSFGQVSSDKGVLVND
ncbi:hypothetical protein APHAL10511_007842 [Amanita phalloides]|nr:hypothetical protein APHAL10511_007842 [Amanita phalloides]